MIILYSCISTEVYQLTEKHKFILRKVEEKYSNRIKASYNLGYYNGLTIRHKSERSLSENDFIWIHKLIDSVSLQDGNWSDLLVYDQNRIFLFSHEYSETLDKYYRAEKINWD